jgi:hypothetical protein
MKLFSATLTGQVAEMRDGSVGTPALAVALGYLVVVPTILIAIAPSAGGTSIGVAILAISVYLMSHALRAARIAMLSAEMLGTSGRTAAAMHFTTAPFVLSLPFKLGELARLFALWRMSRDAVFAVIVLLIDRMYDSLFLLPALAFLLWHGDAPTLLVVLTLFAAVIPLTVIVLGPKVLTEIQRYVVISHQGPSALKLLGRINATRALVVKAVKVPRRQAAELCVISFLIWMCEYMFCLVLFGSGFGAMDLLGLRLVGSWWSAQPMDPLLLISLSLTIIALLLPWPLLAVVFLKRLRRMPKMTSEVQELR